MQKFNNLQKEITEIVEWLKKEFKQISTGQATPAILDSIKVESYGSFMDIAHVAAITITDAKSLKVMPFDKSQTKAVEQAIRDADLGVSLVGESDGIRVIFPQLTTETRGKFVKQAKEKLEDARIKIRKERQESIDEIENAKKESEISEDDFKRKKEEIQKHIDKGNIELESLFKQKEEAIMKI
jgi:ribosome recycling factor